MARLTRLPPMVATAPKPALAEPARIEAERARDQRRRAGDNLRRLYNTARWRHPETGVRVAVLNRDGWTCCRCGVALCAGRKHPNSAVVDHRRPHRGNLALFWDQSNLQSLCKRCHDGAKQREDHASDNGRGGANP